MGSQIELQLRRMDEADRAQHGEALTQKAIELIKQQINDHTDELSGSGVGQNAERLASLLNNPEEKESYLRKAAEAYMTSNKPRESGAEHAGEIYDQLEDKGKAREAYEQAVGFYESLVEKFRADKDKFSLKDAQKRLEAVLRKLK